MIDWKQYARVAIERSHDDAHPDPEVDLRLRDFHGHLHDARMLLAGIAVNSTCRRTLIVGRPGSGKSYLLNWLNDRLASDLLQEISISSQASFQTSEATIVPVLIRLNAFDSNALPKAEASALFSELVEQQLKHVSMQGDIHDLFEQTCTFVLLIDELDEMVTSSTSANLRIMRRIVEFALGFPNVRVIMAGRKIAADRFVANFRTYQVQNLSEDNLRVLFDATMGSKEELLTYLARWEGLRDFISTPYFATQAASFWQQNSEDGFNLGRLLYHVMSNLIERQRKTEYADQIAAKMRRRLASVERLAYRTLESDGRLSSNLLQQEMDSAGDEGLEEWLLLMDFIERSASESQWKSAWIHAYFAAQYLYNYENAATPEARIHLIKISKVTARLYATVLLLQDVLHEDYSSAIELLPKSLEPHIPEAERGFITLAFENVVRDYIKDEHNFVDLYTSYRPAYLGDGEIDIYSVRKRGNVTEIWIVECKFRFPPYPRKLKQEYVEQLLKYKSQVSARESRVAQEEGRTLKLVAILATNGGDTGETVNKLVRTYDIEVWDIDLPLEKFTGRARLSSSQRHRIHPEKRVSKYS